MSSVANGFPFDYQSVPGRQYFGQFPYRANMGYMQPWNMGQGRPGSRMTYDYLGQSIQGYPAGYPGPGFPVQGQAANQMFPGMQYRRMATPSQVTRATSMAASLVAGT